MESAFFRDFVYRNPASKGGKGELADAVVLFDDVALMVQVAAHHSARPATDWAAKQIPEKVRQLQHSHRMLTDGHITVLENEFFGALGYDPQKYTSKVGLVVLDHECEPYDPTILEPALRDPKFPIHVLSLRDLHELLSRLDTAADLILYLDYRHEMGPAVPKLVHREVEAARAVLQHLADFTRQTAPHLPEAVVERTAQMFRETLSGNLRASAGWRYSLIVDEMIARAHDVDESLSYSVAAGPSSSLQIAQFLGWLNRFRRVLLGKRIWDLCNDACDGKQHYFAHHQRQRGTSFVCLSWDAPREQRAKFLQLLCRAAQVNHGTRTVLGVATEANNGKGRSHDYVLIEGDVPEAEREYLLSLRLFTRATHDLLGNPLS